MNIVVLDGAVLRVARNFRNDVYAMPQEEEADENKAMRHAAYRQFILWHFGKLGKGDCRVVPSCVTRKIRDKNIGIHLDNILAFCHHEFCKKLNRKDCIIEILFKNTL